MLTQFGPSTWVRWAPAVIVGAAIACGLVWFATTGQPGLTPLTTDFRLCAPVNSAGNAAFGWDMFRNDTDHPIRVTGFAPDQGSGIAVVGGYFLIDD